MPKHSLAVRGTCGLCLLFPPCGLQGSRGQAWCQVPPPAGLSPCPLPRLLGNLQMLSIKQLLLSAGSGCFKCPQLLEGLGFSSTICKGRFPEGHRNRSSPCIAPRETASSVPEQGHYGDSLKRLRTATIAPEG